MFCVLKKIDLSFHIPQIYDKYRQTTLLKLGFGFWRRQQVLADSIYKQARAGQGRAGKDRAGRISRAGLGRQGDTHARQAGSQENYH